MLQRLLLLVLSVLAVSVAVSLSQTKVPPGMPRCVADWPQLPDDVKLGQVTGVAVDAADQLYIFHRGKRPILVLDKAGRLLRSWGDGLVKTAHGLRIDRDGNIWTTDLGNHTVIKYDATGKVLLTLGRKGQPGVGHDQFNKPADIAFGAGGEIYVADGYGNSRVMKFARDGSFIKEWGKKGKQPGEFNLPHAIIVDGERVYVGDRENNRVQIFNTEGGFIGQWRDTGAPYGLFLTPAKHMLLADGRGNVSKEFDLDGNTLATWGMKGTAAGQFTLPHGICMDSTGAIYVTEVNGQRVQKFVRE